MPISNEMQFAENILKAQSIDLDHIGYNLSVLAKYFIYGGKSYEQARKLLEQFCLANIKNFNFVTDYHNIDYAIKRAKEYKLAIPTGVIVTQQEISSLRSLDNEQYERYLFTALVLAREEKQNPKKKKFKHFSKSIGLYYNGWPYYLAKRAGLNISMKEIYRMQHELHELQYIGITYSGALELKFASDGFPAIVIDEFEDISLFYLRFVGDKRIKTCQNCGGLFRQKIHNQIYCNLCSKDREREKERIRMANKRKRNNSVRMQKF